MNNNRIERAKELAKIAHLGQRRKYSGEAYINHPLRVYERASKYEGITEDGKVASLLHDVVEDTNITLQLILKEFGTRVSDIVNKLTKDGSINYDDYILNLGDSGDKDAIIIKLADLQDNMSDLHEGKLLTRYKKAYTYLNKVLERL